MKKTQYTEPTSYFPKSVRKANKIGEFNTDSGKAAKSQEKKKTKSGKS